MRILHNYSHHCFPVGGFERGLIGFQFYLQSRVPCVLWTARTISQLIVPMLLSTASFIITLLFLPFFHPHPYARPPPSSYYASVTQSGGGGTLQGTVLRKVHNLAASLIVQLAARCILNTKNHDLHKNWAERY